MREEIEGAFVRGGDRELFQQGGGEVRGCGAGGEGEGGAEGGGEGGEEVEEGGDVAVEVEGFAEAGGLGESGRQCWFGGRSRGRGLREGGKGKGREGKGRGDVCVCVCVDIYRSMDLEPPSFAFRGGETCVSTQKGQRV